MPFWCAPEVYGDLHQFDSACDPGHPNFRFHIPDAGAFNTFVDATVRRYKDRVRTFGFGEEMHNRALWRGTLDQFVSIILRPGYVIAKSIDPGLTIVGPDEDWADAVEALLQLEGTYGRWCDVISFHLLNHSGGAVSLLDDANATETQKRIFGLKAVYDRVGLGRPVWLTELGAPSEAGTGGDAGPHEQGRWLREQLDQVWLRPWIDKVFIYRLTHVTWSGPDFGILNPDTSPKPAFTRLAEFIAEQQPPRTSYLAEGASNPFTHDVSLANPAARPAPVKITFLRDGGTPIVVPLILDPLSRKTIRASDVPGAQGALSTVVESTSGAPVVVERTMFSANWKWGHTGNAVASAATRWFFGEGSQGFFDTFVLLANAGVATANVQVRFLVEGDQPFVFPVVRGVDANKRVTVYTGDYVELRDKNFAVAVESDQPIIAERAMYFPGFSNFSWAAGHESAGVPALATEWFHAEGSTGPYFDMYLLLGNPNGSPVHVDVTYLRPDGAPPIVIPYDIAANSRRTINVEQEHPGLADTAVSAKVVANLPIVSERAMYWPDGQWWEAHNSVGLTATATKWGLAEGRVGGPFGFETYVLVANPSSQAANLRVTFLRNGAPPIVREGSDWIVGAGGRFTIGVTPTWNMAGFYDGEFGVVVESLNGVPVVVERAMYWNLPGLRWAGGTNAAGTPIP